MRWTTWGRVAGALVISGLVAGACGGDDDDAGAPAPTAAVPTSVAPSSAAPTTAAPATTTTADPLALPEVIDAAYLDLVLAEIEHVVGDAGRMIQAAGAVTPEAEALLATVYSPEFLAIQVQGLEELVSNPDQLAALRQPLGDRVTTVDTIYSASPQCAFLRVQHNFRAFTTSPGSEGIRYTLLRPSAAGDPLAWIVQDEVVVTDGSVPEDPCSQ